IDVRASIDGKVSGSCRLLVRPAEPPKRGPILKPLLDGSSPFGERDRAFPERSIDSFFERLALPQSAQHRELFRFNAPEIDRILDSVYHEKDRSWLQLCDRSHMLALAALLEGIARKIPVFIFFPHREEQIVHRIMKAEQLHVRMQLQAQTIDRGSCKIFGA